MNKTALKNFATWSRRKLIEQVGTKAFLYGIDEKNGLHMEEQFGQLVVNGQTYPLSMKASFTALQKQLEQKGYKQLLEEVAYTWFNRIIAIRYMEVHEYLPEKVNILSSSVGRVDPDILFEYDTMDLGINEQVIRELINAGDTETAFRILFVVQCNALNQILPFMFEQIQDYTELLLPDFLLDAESVIKTLVQNEELTESFEEIEVIGWLYQYYIAEEKDRVFAQKSKYKKEEIPFATQLFTPKWIVQYMVQNSLGRYWTEAHREDEDLIDKWEYFIKHEEEDFHEKIAPYVNKELKVEDIKLLDPAMGSGHILVYAFEVFYEIYEKCGYPEREIPRLILENNLYGLDIDDRAYQLASFAVVMKAASYSKRFLRSVGKDGIQLNLASIQETNHVSDEVIAYIAQQEVGERYNQAKAFFEQYHNAKTYGSLINITERDILFIEQRFEQIANNPVEDLFCGEQHEIAKQVLPALIHQTKIMRNEYDVLVMNPPYMGLSNMNENLAGFVKKNYASSKADLYSAFMEVDYYLKYNGLYAAINQHSWMFLSSFEKLREKLLRKKFIDSMLHLGPRTFENLSGEVVQSTTFILRNRSLENKLGVYFRLVNEKQIKEKENRFLEALHGKNHTIKYKYNQKDYRIIPRSPIAYWANENILRIFNENPQIGEIAKARAGLQTSDNNRFLRLWHEVVYEKIGFNIGSTIEAAVSEKKWFPHNKGGKFRRWFGNNEYVVNYGNNGREVKEFCKYLNSIKKPSSRMGIANSEEYYFQEGLTWTDVTSGNFGARYLPKGSIFDTSGPTMFVNKSDIFILLGYVNSSLFQFVVDLTMSGLHYNNGVLETLPIWKNVDNVLRKQITEIVQENIRISKYEWDSKETSWDFKQNKLMEFKKDFILLKDIYLNVYMKMDNLLKKLRDNEKKLNQINLSLFNVNNEVLSLINEDEKYRNNISEETATKDFLSYFVGSLFGRYSIEMSGLLFAGGTWDDSNYISFRPNSNGIISFTEKSYFESDIIYKLRDFLGFAFSSETVAENLQWLAESLQMKNGEDAETRLRRYFMDEFFADHCKMYQKRPIYWLVDSGKQKGLRTLIYMHGYKPNTMATIRFEYLQEIQAKYQQEITDLENRLVNPNLNASDKKKLNAEKVLFEKKIDELREFDKRLAAIAAEEIEIDLDDGVKMNYEKFYRGGKGVLAKIK